MSVQSKAAPVAEKPRPLFTPAPWKIETTGWYGGSGSEGGSIGAVTTHGSFTTGEDGKPILSYATRTIIHFTLRGNHLSEEENRANSHLIKAAPEMYGALEGLIAHISAMWPALAKFPEMRAAREALASARGES